MESNSFPHLPLVFFQGQWLWGAEDFILTNFIYAMLIAICEEYIFRGMILGTLVSKKSPTFGESFGVLTVIFTFAF